MTTNRDESGCPFCFGASVQLSRAGHDPSCITAQRHPVTATTRHQREATP